MTTKSSKKTKVVYYLACDLDKEIFKDESGKEFTEEQVKKMLDHKLMIGESLEISLTMMANRLIHQFNYNWEEAREFYNSK